MEQSIKGVKKIVDNSNTVVGGDQGVDRYALTEIFSHIGAPLDCGEAVCNQTPRAYQLEDTRHHLKRPLASNFSDVGTGKSLTSYLYIMHKLYSGKKCVVVMPPPLVHQYIREFQWIITGHDFDMQLINKPPAKRRKIIEGWKADGWPHILLMSYQMFVKVFSDIIKSKQYSVLVLDEAHNIKNQSSQAWMAAYRLVNMEHWDMLRMTATPVATGLEDAYGHIKLTNPDVYRNREHFYREHVVQLDMDNYKKIIDYKNVKEIKEWLNKDAVRHRANEVLTLEQPTVQELALVLSEPHMTLYKKLLAERMLEYGDQLLVADNQQKLRQMALQLVTNPAEYSENIPKDDVPISALRTLLETIDVKHTKVAVFCHFKTTVKRLAEELKGFNPALVYGESNVPKNVDKFLHDPSCRVAVLNYRSGGAGFNLQSVCHNMIFFETTGSPSDYRQAVGRVQRSGQKNVVNVWLFRYCRTISERLIDSALGRDDRIIRVMKDKKSVLQSLYL